MISKWVAQMANSVFIFASSLYKTEGFKLLSYKWWEQLIIGANTHSNDLTWPWHDFNRFFFFMCFSFLQLSKTNFSNNNDFRALLQSLYATFKEFKMHEQIENECIIGLLQQRSRTVYNVHSDNKLSEMLSLFEKGLKNVKVSRL